MRRRYVTKQELVILIHSYVIRWWEAALCNLFILILNLIVIIGIGTNAITVIIGIGTNAITNIICLKLVPIHQQTEESTTMKKLQYDICRWNEVLRDFKSCFMVDSTNLKSCVIIVLRDWRCWHPPLLLRIIVLRVLSSPYLDRIQSVVKRNYKDLLWK